jgi:4-oxalocrotonate tautomerase
MLMPVVNVKLVGTLTHEQKEELSKRITDAIQDVCGKPPQYTYVIIDEVPGENWAHAGKLFG